MLSFCVDTGGRGGGGYNIVSTLHEHLHASGLEQLHGNVCVKHWCFIFWVLSIREGVNTNFRVSTLGMYYV